MAERMQIRGKWKNIEVDPNAFLQHDLSGFVCMQELTDYEIVTGNGDKLSKKSKSKKKPKSNISSDSQILDVKDEPKTQKSGKKTSARNTQQCTEDNNVCVSDSRINASSHTEGASSSSKTTDGVKAKKRKKLKKTRKRKADVSVEENEEETPGPKRKMLKVSADKDMSAWKDLFVPACVLKALDVLNFTAPTPIQTLSLPSAIRDHKDIVGAAETGSGKTLAFGIPIIHSILRDIYGMRCNWTKTGPKKAMKPKEVECNSEDDVTGSEEDDSDVEPTILDPEETMEESKEEETRQKKIKPLYALVLTPTRELAIQVRDHIVAAAKFTRIKVVTLVGGMAIEKQTRLLAKEPEIVVATPGRLWELMESGDPHLAKISDIKALVIDEADRMVEKGHFEELTKLLQFINRDEEKRSRRQTFVFSATLTFVHSGPPRLKYKKKAAQLTEKQKLDDLMSLVGIKPKPKIVDLTRSERTAETLTEARLSCTTDEKDILLYYFLTQYPGRTLVFANSKDCIRRLVSIFSLLKCCPLPLHADMHQRQRLKNLDRFKGNPRGLLLATDVAARGLDIPDVKHVIHYQVPRTTENYVHRSGRTARASKEGLSVVLVGPEDLQFYRKIIKCLNRDEDLPTFPIDQSLMPAVKARVNTARHIDKLQHRFSKQKMQNNWFAKAAEDLDIILDGDDLLNDLGSDREQSQLRKSLDQHHLDLKRFLQEPLTKQAYMGKYPTKSGKLLAGRVNVGSDDENAVQQLQKAQNLNGKRHRKRRIKTKKKSSKNNNSG